MFARAGDAIWLSRVKYPGTKPHSALPIELIHQPEDESVVTLAVPGFRQVRNYSCGYTAALMVLRHFDCQIEGQQLFAELGTTREGTGQSAIVKVLRAQGLRANLRYDMNFARIRRCIDVGKVLIGYLEDEHHWLVLYGYGDAPERVFVADPEPGKTCEQAWESYGPRLHGFSIVCSPRQQPAGADAAGSHATEKTSSPSQVDSQQLSFAFTSQS